MDDMTQAQRDLAEQASTLCAGWAQREGILERVNTEQFTDIAKGFMAGFMYGVQVGLGDDPDVASHG